MLVTGFHLERLQSQKQSTVCWLTPNDDLTQWDANFLFLFFLLCFLKWSENKMLCCNGGWQRVEELPMLWYPMLGTRTSMQKQEQHSVMVKNLRMRDKRDTHTERDIGTKNKLYSRRQQLQMTIATTTNFTKVTRSLYIVTNIGHLPFMLCT